jgi:hypothetical protein
MLPFDGREHVDNLFLAPSVAAKRYGATAGTFDLCNQGLKFFSAAASDANDEPFTREPPRDCRTEMISGTYDDSYRRRVRHREFLRRQRLIAAAELFDVCTPII